ncbi:alpha beta-hydrolase [Rhodofomes roseus]|uniref:Alpha beta-hydrolase n=1 Tax=Rhodofomes roseus TaxID=34475 RepID=A0ABQ8KU40_9APHY|nr:alpha beta-hydrolase [Rhodofomes roseus]KAH9841586.1 alpha beta-hydrolase [Rhodofomes roseus]
MRSLGLFSVLVACVACGVGAVPPPIHKTGSTDFLDPSAVTTLTSADITTFEPYEQFARAAYCSSSSVADWLTCSLEACSAISGFQPTVTGGDGNSIQLYYVGYWPAQNAVVVAHEGTDPTQLLSDLTDVDILQENLDSTLFPGVSSDVWVHSGFADEHAKTASAVLSAATSIISSKGAETVICIGHSLGGALAELDVVFFKLHLPSTVAVLGRTFGTPRVGNGAWADLVNSLVPDFTRMNNVQDPIPIVPGRFLGYQHPETELHVVSDSADKVVACPGNDDATDADCTISSVPNIFEADILDHLGPYPGGVYMGTIYCT